MPFLLFNLLLALVAVPESHQYEIFHHPKPKALIKCPPEGSHIISYRLRDKDAEDSAMYWNYPAKSYILEVTCGFGDQVTVLLVTEDVPAQKVLEVIEENGNGCLKEHLTFGALLAADAWKPRPRDVEGILTVPCKMIQQLSIY